MDGQSGLGAPSTRVLAYVEVTADAPVVVAALAAAPGHRRAGHDPRSGRHLPSRASEMRMVSGLIR